MSSKVSIIIPAYNAEKTIETSVGSVQKQTYKDIEILIIDDGSEDQTRQMCRSIEANDIRCHVVHKKNGGVSSARNIGMQAATGSYIMFADSDDEMQPDHVEKYVEAIVARNADVVIGGINWYENGICEKRFCSCEERYGDEIWNTICIQPEMFGYLFNKIYKTDIIRHWGIRFDEQMYSQEDLAFNLSYFANCESFYVSNYVGYNYYYQPGKRTPPVWDFIANSLKMRRIALSKVKLSDQAEQALQQRIFNNIFCYLYEQKPPEEYISAYEKVRNIEHLPAYLRETHTAGEYRVLVKCILQDNPEKLFRYFKLRDTAKRLFKKGS
ncbi:MAG: glycosyltransferase family 2 protein [Clostridiales bacterium]|nr:glycosyltransferase family 2 protein [Clostridiales bacterium]